MTPGRPSTACLCRLWQCVPELRNPPRLRFRLLRRLPTHLQPSPSLAPALASSQPRANPQDGPLYLTLQTAVQMALKNNLDIELERADQAVADLSVPLAKGGGLPRSINYTVADTPPGEAPVAVPLLSFSAPGLSPLSVDPITSTVSSSYNTSHVLEGSPLPGVEFGPVFGWVASAWVRRAGVGPVRVVAAQSSNLAHIRRLVCGDAGGYSDD